MNKLIIFGIIIIITLTSSIILFTTISSTPEDIIEEIIKCQPQEQNNTLDVGNDKIVFASYRDENWEIYTMNADGSEQTRLTNNELDDKNPDW